MFKKQIEYRYAEWRVLFVFFVQLWSQVSNTKLWNHVRTRNIDLFEKTFKRDLDPEK